MSIVVRSADLGTDKQLIIDFLANHHTKGSDEKRFDWLYRSCPSGEARVWLAIDADSQAVGVAAAFPRRMYIAGKEERAWVLGDFCIHGQQRSLGPAVQLQRACLAGLGAIGGTAYYDFPSQSMTAVYQRLGILHSLEMTRFAAPLRADRTIRKLVKQPQLARLISATVNTGLSLRTGNIHLPTEFELSKQEDRCGLEFSQLASNVSSSVGSCAQRSADYLNWRYLQHPSRTHEMFVLRQNTSLIGYTITAVQGDHLNIIDLFGTDHAIPHLVRSMVYLAQQSKLDSVSVTMFARHPWVRVLRKLGFREREKFSLVLGSLKTASRETSPWLLMDGDRES